MRRLTYKPPNDRLIFALFGGVGILLVIISFIGCKLLDDNTLKSKVINPEYLRGNAIELPEELTAANESDNLGVYIQDGKIDLYFKPKMDYQLTIKSDSITLYDRTRKVGTVSWNQKQGLNKLIEKDNK